MKEDNMTMIQRATALSGSNIGPAEECGLGRERRQYEMREEVKEDKDNDTTSHCHACVPNWTALREGVWSLDMV